MNQNQTSVSPQPNEMLEFYKFHADLYDRANERKYSISRLHISLLTVILTTSVAFASFVSNDLPLWKVFVTAGSIAGYMGMVLSYSWLIQLRAHSKSMAAKFVVLKELEEKMFFDFFSREEKQHSSNEPHPEDFLPRILFRISVITVLFSIGFGLWRKLCGG